MPFFSVGSISDLNRRLMDVKSRRRAELLSPAHPRNESAVAASLRGEVLSVQWGVTERHLCLWGRNTDRSNKWPQAELHLLNWCIVTQALALSQQPDLFIKGLLNSGSQLDVLFSS